MSNVSDVSIRMRHLRSTTLQIAAKRGKARANTRHVLRGARGEGLGPTMRDSITASPSGQALT